MSGETPVGYPDLMLTDTLTYTVPTRSGGQVDYELGPDALRAPGVEIACTDVQRVTLRNLGGGSHRCLVRASDGRSIEILGPPWAQHAFAGFVDELSRRLAVLAPAASFRRGKASRFAWTGARALLGLIVTVVTAVSVFDPGALGVNSGWFMALPVTIAFAFAGRMASIAARERPGRYDPARLPFRLAPLLGRPDP